MTGKRPDGEVDDDLPDPPALLSTAYTTSAPTTTGPEMPANFGRYIVRGVRGSGGFATVYAGYDSQLDRQVAIKVPSRLVSRDTRDIFLREARNLARLRHAGIVTVFDVGVDNDLCFIVSDLLDGAPLQEWLKGRTPHWREVTGIIAAVAEALAHAHEHSVIHRDVKPGNIILTSNRGPVLVDFGLAIADDARASELGAFSGTPAFMSPEQIEGRAHRIDGRTDIYSLGVTLYLMICGRLPFRARSLDELRRQILEDEPQPPRQLVPNLPAELERVCLTAMAKVVNQRFTTAGDMARALRDLLGGPADRRVAQRDVNADAPRARHGGATREAAPVPRVQRRRLSFLAITWEAPGSGDESDDDLVEVTTSFARLCQEIVGRYDGTVLHSGSHALEVCFGYPVAQEDAARRAVYAALDVRDALKEPIAGRSADRLQGWISVHTGTVVVRQTEDGKFDIAGDPLAIVQRLDSVTSPGEVFITHDVQRLVSRYFEVEDAGSSRVRGAREPVALCRVVSVVTGGRSLESPGVALTPLIGRDQELGLLFDRWNQTSEGIGQWVMLAGDAGLGKSRLVHMLKEHVTLDVDPPIVEWRCSPYHSSSALYPAIEYWQRTLGFLPGEAPGDQLERLKEHLRGLELDLGTTVPLIGSLMGLPDDDEYPPQALVPQRQKELTNESIAAWLAAQARKRPLLFIVEDLHWLDPSTLDLLVSLVDDPLPAPIMCVFTFRPEFHIPWTSRRVTQVALNRLTRSQIAEMMRSRAGAATLPSALIERVVERTDGVPLFVEELTKAIAESGRLPSSLRGHDSVSVHDSTDALARLTVPDSLQDLLMARLDRLGGNNVVVQMAAAIGRQFRPDLLSAASGLSDEDLATELDRLVRAELVYRQGRPPDVSYIFKHALIQDAAYESMVKRERMRVHASIAECLATTFPDVVAREPETQAHHLTEAGLLDQAVEYWETAGSRAVQRSNYPEALAHLTRAVELLKQLPETPERDRKEYRVNVPLGIATLSLRGYASPELGELYERRYQLCDRIGDDMGRLHAIWALSSWRIVRDEQDIAKQLAERIIALAEQIGDEGARMEALFIGQIVAFYRGELEDAARFADAAMERYDAARCQWHMARLGQHAGVATLSYLALTQWHLGYPDTAFTTMTRATEMARALGHPFSVAFVLYHSALLNKSCRLGNEAQRAGEEQIAVAKEAYFSFWEATGNLYRAGGLVEQGRHQEARDQLLRALPWFEGHGAALGLPFYRSYLAEAYLGLGDLEQARATLDSAMAAAAASHERFHEPELLRLQAVVAQRRGDLGGARALLEQAITLARSQSTRSWELRATTTLAELLAHEGRAAEGHARLSAVYGRFTEGFSTPDLAAAEALLRDLA